LTVKKNFERGNKKMAGFNVETKGKGYDPAKFKIRKTETGVELYLNGEEIPNVLDYKITLMPGKQFSPRVWVEFVPTVIKLSPRDEFPKYSFE
jgi:hypothetical protein